EKGGLRLDSSESMVKGGETGPAIVPGDAQGSLLIQAVPQLPRKPKTPKGGGRKLTAEEIAVLSEWIQAGAPWPTTSTAAKPAAPADKPITPEKRAFWSFQPIASHTPPAVKGTWAQTPIDRFILARLEKEGIAPVAPA